MRVFQSRSLRFFLTAIAAVAGAVVGTLAFRAWFFDAARIERTVPYTVYPLPHHIAKNPGGVSFRFAMAHDVIHERFLRHGRAYYEERNRRVRQVLQEEKRPADIQADAARFALLDDLGVGLDLLGKHQEAIDLMRAKLKEQESLGQISYDLLYSSYANLGTFLILWQIQEGFADVPTARQRLTEGLGYVHKSIEVNPQSHFGREIWQAVILEYLLAMLDDPNLVLRYDMVGNRLDAAMEKVAEKTCHRRDLMLGWTFHEKHRHAKGFLKGIEKGGTPTEPSREDYREYITLVGAEDGWTTAVKSSHQQSVPFDEPALGIIGMWRLGGGANPHFALALGEIMMRVGQRHIAWCAYERATQMANHVGSPAIAEKFIAHCRARQAIVERQLPPEEVSGFRPRFEKELAHGKRYQQAYQDYEAQRIRADDSIDDPHFYDAFHAEHGPIASPSGPEEEFRALPAEPFPFLQVLAAMLFGAGLAAFVTAFVLRFLARPRPAPADDLSQPANPSP